MILAILAPSVPLCINYILDTKIYDDGHAHYFGCCVFHEFSEMNMMLMVVHVVSTQIYFYNNERFQMQ